jgi:hypothetical protein
MTSAGWKNKAVPDSSDSRRAVGLMARLHKTMVDLSQGLSSQSNLSRIIYSGQLYSTIQLKYKLKVPVSGQVPHPSFVSIVMS